jgi:hypothetical protein
MQTFVYKGTGTSLIALGAELKKGEPFTTDDKQLIELLSNTVDVEEVKPGEVTKPPRKPDVDRS